MTFDGARAFFGMLKWLGWVLFVVALVQLAMAFGERGPSAWKMLAGGLFGASLGVVALGMIGQMIAAVATDIQIIREIAERRAQAEARDRT
jgi:uncharacterized membrane protein